MGSVKSLVGAPRATGSSAVPAGTYRALAEATPYPGYGPLEVLDHGVVRREHVKLSLRPGES